MFPLDLLADLPEPRDDEPLSLRADIADELADHLQCAFRREVFKDGDTAAAQRRALDRFGDPQQLARRLWWQAMRSRLMKQRIVFALQWMVALTAMLISGAVFWQQSQLLAELRQARQEDAAQRQALTAKLNQLQPLPAAPDVPAAGPADDSSRPDLAPESALLSLGELNSPVLRLKFVQETEDGPPVMPESATLTNSSGEVCPGRCEPPTKNKVCFWGLKPDLYMLNVSLADGQWCHRPLLVRDDNKRRELDILCPGPRKKTPVSISIHPLPEELQKKDFVVRMTMGATAIEFGQAKWGLPNTSWQRITFDAQSGLPVGIAAVTMNSPAPLDLRDLPVDERLVFLPVGTVSYRFEASERRPAPSTATLYRSSVTLYQWPNPATKENENQHVIAANESHWRVELPKEFLEEMLRDVAEANVSSAATRVN